MSHLKAIVAGFRTDAEFNAWLRTQTVHDVIRLTDDVPQEVRSELLAAWQKIHGGAVGEH